MGHWWTQRLESGVNATLRSLDWFAVARRTAMWQVRCRGIRRWPDDDWRSCRRRRSPGGTGHRRRAEGRDRAPWGGVDPFPCERPSCRSAYETSDLAGVASCTRGSRPSLFGGFSYGVEEAADLDDPVDEDEVLVVGAVAVVEAAGLDGALLLVVPKRASGGGWPGSAL